MNRQKLDMFNTLPPRPEHIAKITNALQPDMELKVAELVGGTGLTKTQVLCALNLLVRQDLVAQKINPLRFSLIAIKPSEE